MHNNSNKEFPFSVHVRSLSTCRLDHGVRVRFSFFLSFFFFTVAATAVFTTAAAAATATTGENTSPNKY